MQEISEMNLFINIISSEWGSNNCIRVEKMCVGGKRQENSQEKIS